MTDTATPKTTAAKGRREGRIAQFLHATEIDTRLLGMIGALLLIWVGFHFFGLYKNGFGAFLTPRNLWNLSVQTSSIGIMATGMVLVIVTRNIDLSVGSILGFCAILMGVLQVKILPQYLGIGHPAIWMLAVLAGIIVGSLIGGVSGRADRLSARSRPSSSRWAACWSGAAPPFWWRAARPSRRSTRPSRCWAAGHTGRSARPAAGSSG